MGQGELEGKSDRQRLPTVGKAVVVGGSEGSVADRGVTIAGVGLQKSEHFRLWCTPVALTLQEGERLAFRKRIEQSRKRDKHRCSSGKERGGACGDQPLLSTSETARLAHCEEDHPGRDIQAHSPTRRLKHRLKRGTSARRCKPDQSTRIQ